MSTGVCAVIGQCIQVFCDVIGRCVQVLTVVKHRLDNYLVTVSNYESLFVQASQYLAWRDDVTRQGSNGVTRRDSILSLPTNLTQRSSGI